jgi:hypothetical protein
MAGETPKAPRYPDVTAADWVRVHKVITIMVARHTKGALGDPRDIATEAIRRAQEPTTREWDRTKPLHRHVGSFANSLMANGFRKQAFLTTDLTDPAAFERVIDETSRVEGPEEALARAQANARAASRIATLRDVLKEDGCCVVLLDAVAAHEEKPHEQATAAGFTYRQVELAREKIERAATKLAADEARTARKKGYIL